jgi:hypothetical protein
LSPVERKKLAKALQLSERQVRYLVTHYVHIPCGPKFLSVPIIPTSGARSKFCLNLTHNETC